MRFVLVGLVAAIALFQIAASSGEYGYPKPKAPYKHTEYPSKAAYDYLERVWVQNINKNKNRNQDETKSENESINGNLNWNDLILLKKIIEEELSKGYRSHYGSQQYPTQYGGHQYPNTYSSQY